MTTPWERYAGPKPEAADGGPWEKFQHNDPLTKVKDTIEATGIPNALKASGNFVLDKISWLDAPRNALWQGLQQAPFETDKVGPFKILNEEALKGLKRDTFGSTQDLLPEEFREINPGASIVAGVAGDIATDPLTYTPAGVLTAPVRAGHGILKATGLINPLKRLADDSELLRWLNVHTGDSLKAKEIAQKYKDFKNASRYRGIEDAKVFNNELKQLSNDLGIPAEQLKADIMENVETGNLSTGPTKQHAIEENLINRNKEMLALEQELGVKIGDLGETYMAHVITPEGRAALGAREIKDYLSNQPTLTHSSTKMRELEGTVAEINAKGHHGTDKFFYDDPVISQAVREVRHAQVVGGAQYLNDVKQMGVPTSQAPKDWVTVSGIKDMSFDPKVAEVIDQQFKIISNPEQIKEFWKLYDGAQNWWKMWSLGARPAYHARNMVGNVWNAYLGGLTNIQRYADATNLQVMMATGKVKGKIAGKDATELMNAAIDNGILNKGQYYADIEKSIIKDLPGGRDSRTALGAVWKYTGSTDNPVLQAGFKAGNEVENNARLALFLDQVDKGKSYEDAAQHAKKYLFDYQDLSPVEQKVFKRIMPFYTWSRKNIPLQIEALATQQDKINKINIVKQNIERDADKPDQENVQSFVKKSMPVYLGKSPEDDQVKMFTLMNYLPLADVGRLSSPDEFLGMLSPLMKAPMEYLMNYDTFREKEIEEYKGQTTDYMGVRMPVHLAHLAKNLIMLNEIDRANPGNVFGKSTYDPVTEERERTRSFGMESEKGFSIPGVGLRRGVDNEFGTQTGKMRFGVGTPREERTDLPGSARVLQYLLGIRLYNVDEDQGEARKYQGMKRDINKLKYLLKASGRQGKEREFEELLEALDNAASAFD